MEQNKKKVDSEEKLQNNIKKVKVNVIYGNKTLVDCMKNVIVKHTKQ